jgi:hypothetical protein
MAYSTGSYTDIEDALDLFSAWAVTNGWTENMNTLEDSRRRVHIQKTIGSSTFYFNFKTMDSQTPFGHTGYGAVTGIALNGSTGYDVGSSWDAQPGYTTESYDDSSTSGGCVDSMIAEGGTYYFFATDTTLSAVFETESSQSDWRMMTVGSLDGSPFYSASGGDSDLYDTTYDNRSAYLCQAGVGEDRTNRASIYSGVYWYGMSGTITSEYAIRPAVYANTVYASSDRSGSLPFAYINYSPDAFRGNAVLVPSVLTCLKTSSSEFYPIAEVEGVKLINMQNYVNEEEITYGSDTYKLFRIFNPAKVGIAFLK